MAAYDEQCAYDSKTWMTATAGIAVTSSPHSLPLEPGPKLVTKHSLGNSPHAELAHPNKP